MTKICFFEVWWILCNPLAIMPERKYVSRSHMSVYTHSSYDKTYSIFFIFIYIPLNDKDIGFCRKQRWSMKWLHQQQIILNETMSSINISTDCFSLAIKYRCTFLHCLKSLFTTYVWTHAYNYHSRDEIRLSQIMQLWAQNILKL